MGEIIFNGISSLDYGIQVEHPPAYQIPARDYEMIHIPGRNGDLAVDSGTYQNVTRTYEISMGGYGKDFYQMANSLAEWLHSASGYARLEDSYEPEYYRMAVCNTNVEVENILSHAGRATIEFNCKPQKYLKSGEEEINLHTNPSNIDSTITLYNPTNFFALPCIIFRASGDGKVTFSSPYGIGYASSVNYTITFNDLFLNAFNEAMVDSEQQIISNFSSGSSSHGNIDIPYGFPKLTPGLNRIDILDTNGDTKLEGRIIPRWWTI